MASIFGSDVRLHGGSLDMLSLDLADEVLTVEPPLPCRDSMRDFLAEVRGLAACGRSSSISRRLPPAAQKQFIIVYCCWKGHAKAKVEQCVS